MSELHERDMMKCRSCGRPERASEGYPCAQCGTFVCLLCNFRGITHCAACARELGIRQPPPAEATP